MVIEKSWNLKNWPKVMEFCDSVMKFYQFCFNLYYIYIFLVTTKKLRSHLESPHFLTFSAKRRKLKIKERDGHGKSRNGHGQVMDKSWKNILSSLWEP